MGLFYKVSDKEMVNIRNKIFLEKGVPALEKNGFEKAPFPTYHHGRNSLQGFSYTFCRLHAGLLEMLEVHIIKGDKWIQIRLNIFELYPSVKSLDELTKSQGIKFLIPPASLTNMRLRSDDYKFIPIITVLCYKEHKLGSYNSKGGLRRKVRQLEQLIEKDMTNIDSFVARWHELHTPAKVDWEGSRIE